VLQDWDQSLAVEQPFGQVSQTIERILKLKQSVDSLEGVNQQMAEDVGIFRELQGTPPAAEEGAIVVVTADCKGIVIRGQGTKTVCGGERPGGKRANQKKMATVGAVYTVEPYVRTPKEVAAALFNDPDYKPPPRPAPCHKRVWASLPHEGPRQEAASTWYSTGCGGSSRNAIRMASGRRSACATARKRCGRPVTTP
jgi:hypothetical protein